MEKEKKLISSQELFSAIGELLAQGRQAVFTVTGMSMWPFLCHGRDQVVVEACKPEEIRVGDVVLLQTYLGNYLLHRVTKIKGDCFETTGDGNCFRDGYFPFSAVRARVVRMIRKGRNINCDSVYWKLVFFFWRQLFPSPEAAAGSAEMDQQVFSQKKKEKWLKLNSKCTKSPGMELPHWMKRFLIIKCDSPKPGLFIQRKKRYFFTSGVLPVR